MAAPEKVTQNTTGSTSSPTQVTTHTHNIMNTDTKNNQQDENVGDRVNDDGDDSIASPKNLGLVCVGRHAESSSSGISGITDGTPPHPLAI